jgi:hypothetical protein
MYTSNDPWFDLHQVFTALGRVFFGAVPNGKIIRERDGGENHPPAIYAKKMPDGDWPCRLGKL